jgi:hypothetical protein
MGMAKAQAETTDKSFGATTMMIASVKDTAWCHVNIKTRMIKQNVIAHGVTILYHDEDE